jgi:hypothetical protein
LTITQVKEAIIEAKDKKAAGESRAQAAQKEATDPVFAFQLVSKSIKLDPKNSLYTADYDRIKKEIERREPDQSAEQALARLEAEQAIATGMVPKTSE